MALDKELKEAAERIVVSVALTLHDVSVLWSAGMVVLPSLDINNQRDLFESLSKLKAVADKHAGTINL